MSGVNRARPVDASTRPAQNKVRHGILEVGTTPVPVASFKCSTIMVWPESTNEGLIYFGARVSDQGDALSTDNGMPLTGFMVFGQNMSSSRARTHLVASEDGCQIRYYAVL